MIIPDIQRKMFVKLKKTFLDIKLIKNYYTVILQFFK